MKAAYGFSPGKAGLNMFSCRRFVWLAAARAASFRRTGWSRRITTARKAALQGLSGLDGKNYFTLGFYAADQASEAKCPDVEINQLIQISDVTAEVLAGTKDKSGAEFVDARKAVVSKISRNIVQILLTRPWASTNSAPDLSFVSARTSAGHPRFE